MHNQKIWQKSGKKLNSDQDENFYTEIVEYVRVAVLLLFTEMNSNGK